MAQMEKTQHNNLIQILDILIPCLIVIQIIVGVYEFTTGNVLDIFGLGLDGKTMGMIDIFSGLIMIPIFYLIQNKRKWHR